VSWAIWITGLPGSGKSAIARAAAAELSASGVPVQLLELDALRRVLTPAPTYDAAEREAVYRALVVIARVLTCAERPVIIDATAHRRAWRDFARACIAEFAEVQLVCPLEVARERERTRPPGHHPRAIYAHAGRPGASVPGVDVPYEPAISPELTLDTTEMTLEQASARVVALARSLPRRPAAAPVGTAPWALWVSGRPGSGKTTVASQVCQALAARGVAVTVLEPAEFAALMLAGASASRAQREMVARAVVLAARLLIDAGVVVIIDGAAPIGEADRLAREVIDEFSWVELVCPTDVCRSRERAVRWNLVPCPSAPRLMAPPDLGLDYEPVLSPDLVLYTDVIDHWTAAHEVLDLVDRLERTARRRRLPCA
jgi:adenylylsulfate kinase